MGQAECPAPSLCLCPGQGQSARVYVGVPVWTSVPGHVIVCICLWFLSPGLSVSEWEDMDILCVPMCL